MSNVILYETYITTPFQLTAISLSIDVTVWLALTCKDSWHERSKHKKQHGKKEEAGVAEDFLSFIANA